MTHDDHADVSSAHDNSIDSSSEVEPYVVNAGGEQRLRLADKGIGQWLESDTVQEVRR